MFETLKTLHRDRDKLILSETRILLWLSLFYPFGEKPATIFDKIKYFIVIFIAFLFVHLTTIIYAFLEAADWLQLLEVVCPVFSTTIMIGKQLVFIVKREKIRLLLRRLQAEWDEHLRLFDDKSVQVMTDTKRLCHRITLVMSVWVGIMVAAYISISFVIYLLRRGLSDFEKKLPLPLWLPYDLEDGINYDITFMLLLFSIYIFATSHMSFDTVYCGVICHVTTHFKLLRIRIDNLKNLSTDHDFEEVAIEIQHCIDRHNVCIQLVNETEDILASFTFIQFIGSSILICLSVFVVQLNFGSAATKSIPIMSGSIAQLFLFCWICNHLLTSTGYITKAVFDLPWYSYPKTVQKSVLMMIVRGRKPLGITAAKFYYVNYESFQSVN